MRLTHLADYAVVLMTAAARREPRSRLSATDLSLDTGVPLPTAQKVQRRVQTLKVNGEFKGEKLHVDYDAKRAEEKRFSETAGQGQLVDFFANWCIYPSQARVSSE